MSEQEFTESIQNIRQQIETLHRYIISMPTQQQQISQVVEDLAVSIQNLQLLQEQKQVTLEQMEVIQEELIQQNEYLVEERQHYYDLYQFAPDASLLTNATGIIMDANRAAGSLFNVLPNFLVGKPLLNFVAEAERSIFCTKLNQVLSVNSVQEWELVMCSLDGQPFDAVLVVLPVGDHFKSQVSLQINVRDVTKYKPTNFPPLQDIDLQLLPKAAAVNQPYLLDGLQVLFVDDEADAREYITAVLEQQGICVTVVATVAEALRVLERSRPDVIVSDIRMPEEDGYALIKKVRALEADLGWHIIPALAITAYLAEDRAKALKAGFQSHLHKLTEPRVLIERIAQLAGRG